MNFTPPHQQIFIDFSIFPKKILTVHVIDQGVYYDNTAQMYTVQYSISLQVYVMTSIAFWWYPDPKKYVCKQ